MYFRMTRLFPSEFFGSEELPNTTFHFSDSKARIRFGDPEQGDETPSDRRVVCEVTIERQPGKSVVEVLENIAAGFYDQECKEFQAGWIRKRQAGETRGGCCLPWDVLPQAYKDFFAEISKKMNTLVINTCNTLKWVTGAWWLHSRLIGSTTEWSVDGTKWNILPSKIVIGSVSWSAGLSWSADEMDEVKKMVESGESEPLAHELLREAVGLRPEYPDVALIMAVSAAEIGIKQYIGRSQPETEWLIENMPSPDILRMLREYIPKIKPQNEFLGRVVIPENSILSKLKKAVPNRNRLIHVGETKHTHEDLDALLSCVSDLLYLLDYYSGRDWALGHLSESSLLELGVDA